MIRSTSVFMFGLISAAALVCSACELDNYIAGERLTDQCSTYCDYRVSCDSSGTLASSGYAENCHTNCGSGTFNDDATELSPELIGCALHYSVYESAADTEPKCGEFLSCVQVGGYRSSDDEGSN